LDPNVATQKRSEIQKLLRDSWAVSKPDLQSPISKSEPVCYVHYYNMGKAKYDSVKDFTITIVFGDDATSEMEAFVYDVRELWNNGYITAESTTCYIPIPFNDQRWDYVKNNTEHLKNLSYSDKTLDYPLLRTEVLAIMVSVQSQPVVCTTKDECVNWKITQQIDLFDFEVIPNAKSETAEEVILAVDQLMIKEEFMDIDGPNPNATLQNHQSELDAKTDIILIQLKQLITNLFDTWNPEWDSVLQQQDLRDSIKSLISVHMDDAKILSILTHSFLKKVGLEGQ
jgi:hypothetical protein